MDPRPASPVFDHTTLTPPRLHTPRPGAGAGASPPRRDASNSEAQSPAAPTPVPLRDMLADPLQYIGGDSRGSGVRGRATAGSSGAVGQHGSGSIHASGVSSGISNSLGGSVKGGGSGSPAASAGGNGSQAISTPGNTPRSKGYPVVSWTAGSASAREPPGPPPSPGPQGGCNSSTPQRSPEQRAAPLSARETGGQGSILAALWSRGTPAGSGNGSGQICGTPDQSPPPSARDVLRKGPDVSLPGTPKGPAPQAVPTVSSNSTPLRRPLLQQHQRHGNSGTSQAESVERRPSGASTTSQSAPAGSGAETRDSSRSADISRRRAGYPQQVPQQSTPPAASTPQQQHQHQQALPQSPRPEARYVIRQPLTLGSVPRTGISTTPLSARARTGPASQTMGQTSMAPQGSLSAREQTSRGAVHPASATGGTPSAAARSTQSTQSPMARMAYPTAWAFGGRMR